MTTGIHWLDVFIAILLGITAFLTASQLFWTRVLRPIVRAARRTEETLPVLLDIAQDFQGNDGSTLKDTLDLMSDGARELSEYAHSSKHALVNQLTVISGDLDLLTEKVDRLEGLSERVGGLGGEVSEIKEQLLEVKVELTKIKTIVDRRSASREPPPLPQLP